MMLRKGIILIALILVPFIVLAQQDGPAELSEYRWENRLLLLFTPTSTDGNYQQQLTELENKAAGLNERDLRIFHLISSEGAYVGNNKNRISPAVVNRLVQKYKINPGQFTVILIGKDGTEKLREANPITTDELFAVIDVMPMRQEKNQ